ncbi:MAG: PEP-CTERM-box response regulator transcription factor [candidate division Zixibacteria bacterium]|nr:PEP-CTERM-box response regulator transcription factor [candidate division Zixibacteria bacterium]
MTDKRKTILIVDDEKGIRDQLSLALESDYKILVAATASKAINAARQDKPNVALIDISLSPHGGDKEGLDLLTQLLENDPTVKAIMVTGHGEKENALQAVGAGAFDFYVKPIELEELKIIIKRALYLQTLEIENAALAESLKRQEGFSEIIGDSPRMREMYKIIDTVAPSRYTVLITGESGTGKELVAKAIHSRSDRAEKPFVTVNCGAIPEALLESELFGHEKGAFTDAHARKIGKCEMAHEGILFLDEVGELPLSLQVKLLRFLQDNVIERVGGKEPIQTDVRVIAATNRPLAEDVERKIFREDLFYRLSVITVELPPLRDRDDDVVLIADHLLKRYAAENNRSNLVFHSSGIQVLRAHDWPGNVRELENRIKRAVILSAGSKLTASDLGLKGAAIEGRRSLQDIRDQAVVDHIRAALLRNDWNISRTARELDISRTNLYDLIEKHKIEKGK